MCSRVYAAPHWFQQGVYLCHPLLFETATKAHKAQLRWSVVSPVRGVLTATKICRDRNSRGMVSRGLLGCQGGHYHAHKQSALDGKHSAARHFPKIGPTSICRLERGKNAPRFRPIHHVYSCRSNLHQLLHLSHRMVPRLFVEDNYFWWIIAFHSEVNV